MVRKEVEIMEEAVRVKSSQIEELQDEVRDHLQVKANNAALTADNEAQRQMRQEAGLTTVRRCRFTQGWPQFARIWF